ncbi:MAG: DUF2461 domain-containing protein [Myxococcota bacterium]
MTQHTFTGFSPGAQRFFRELEANNHKDHWHASKEAFHRDVRDPLRALLAPLEGKLGAFKAFRMNRDTRFSADKSPYKLMHGAGSASPGGSIAYVHVDKDGVFLGEGIYLMSPAQLKRFRGAIDSGAATALKRILASLRRAGIEVGPGGSPPLKTAPRGYPRDHAHVELLRWKGLTAASRPSAATFRSAALSKEVARFFRRTASLRTWIDTHVGAADDRRSA